MPSKCDCSRDDRRKYTRLSPKHTEPRLIEVAPGRWSPACDEKEIEDYLVATLRKNGDGTFSIVPLSQRMIRMDKGIAELMGFFGDWKTLKRLARAGFIELIAIAPHCNLLNWGSWVNHQRRCAEGAITWERGSKWHKAYLEAL